MKNQTQKKGHPGRRLFIPKPQSIDWHLKSTDSQNLDGDKTIDEGEYLKTPPIHTQLFTKGLYEKVRALFEGNISMTYSDNVPESITKLPSKQAYELVQRIAKGNPFLHLEPKEKNEFYFSMDNPKSVIVSDGITAAYINKHKYGINLNPNDTRDLLFEHVLFDPNITIFRTNDSAALKLKPVDSEGKRFYKNHMGKG